MKKTLGILSIALFLGACGQPASPQTPAPSIKGPEVGNNVTAKTQLQQALLDLAKENKSAPSKWIVELRSDPTEVSLGTVLKEQASFKHSLEELQRSGKVKRDVAVTHEYSKLFNGFAISATAEDALKLAERPDVLSVWPSIEIDRPTVQYLDTKPDMYYANDITGVNEMRDVLGLTGKGIKVGVIDSGIDVDHPAFKDRVTKQWDFVGDDFGSKSNVPAPDPIADDCDGHGSHVAGIIGGSDAGTKFKGVAPEVEFGGYRVFGCEGGSDAGIIMAAMERAYTDGMQVINMSLGAPLQWGGYPTARMADRISKKGVIMVVSAGNEGERYGQFSMGAPSVAAEAISVAAVQNTFAPQTSATLTLGGVAKDIGYMHASGSEVAAAGTTVEVAAAPNADLSKDGCEAFPAGLFAGKAALISRGGCSFAEKVKNAVDAGAIGVILVNNAPGLLSAGGLTDVKVPVGMIAQEDGEAARAALAAGQAVKFTYKDPADTNDVKVPGARSITTFSSYGMTPELELKPEVAAPGGNIYSAAPLDHNAKGYVVMSGTSMASPHVAGAVALILDANQKLHPGTTLTPAQVKTRLMNTARPQKRYENHQYSDGFDHVQLQGAGLINMNGAVLGEEMSVVPNKLSLGASSVSPVQHRRLTLKNDSRTEKSFTVKHQPALSVAGSVDRPKSDLAAATVTMDGRSIDGGKFETITVPAGGSKEIVVSITAPTNGRQYSQYGGWISISGDSDEHQLSVPYAGFIGDYQKETLMFKEVVDEAGKEQFTGPLFLGSEKDNSKVIQAKDAATKELELDEKNVADLIIYFSRPARKLEITLLNKNTGEVKPFVEEDHIGRGGPNVWVRQQRPPFVFYTWKAKDRGAARTDASGNVIKYQLVARALKPLGDENNPDHWEVYKSPTFTLNASIDKP